MTQEKQRLGFEVFVEVRTDLSQIVRDRLADELLSAIHREPRFAHGELFGLGTRLTLFIARDGASCTEGDRESVAEWIAGHDSEIVNARVGDLEPV